MEKAFSPSSFEDRLYQVWLNENCFDAGSIAGSTKAVLKTDAETPAFSIMMPPPNVTGVLHNGHALFVTIQDALIRYKRMKGFNTLWLPGVDHAGIATQMVVERDLAKKGVKRKDLGREKFIEKVWEWKKQSGDQIVHQMQKLGASADWKRLQFTLDPHLSKTVRHVFVKLYNQGLLYRGQRLINWCTRCETALSDLEVKPVEKQGAFYHIDYVVEGAPSNAPQKITIATTRPETLIGDTALAVHPDDERYTALIGKNVHVPLVNRLIPIIADDYVDRAFGSGALKVTPAHDFNDNTLGQKHKLNVISIINERGLLDVDGVVYPDGYRGLTMAQAREKIVTDLQNAGLLQKIEPHMHNVGVCDRCERVVEPFLSEQWFVKATVLAKPALEAVRRGTQLSLAEVDSREDAIKILPESWVNTYYHWMENITDWCVSRQLWWGHQIPAFTCVACGHLMVAEVDPTTCSKCGASELKQDPDVLDTWFSSALWPFSTLGWPEKTEDFKLYYPNAVMETGFDILFFWVARMIMMGMHFNDGRVPFKRVYLHAMVRDEKGQKMSKTKGNVIDPLEMVAEYGADAFRFTLAALAGQGRDVKLSLDRVDGYKAFCNKLWNASRFLLMRLSASSERAVDAGTDAWVPEKDASLRFDVLQGKIATHFTNLHSVNRWILRELEQVLIKVERGFDEFRLDDVANATYTFVWKEFCDWYIEFSKELLNDQTSSSAGFATIADETKAVLVYTLESILRLAHPIIPFITEEIYQYLPSSPVGSVLMMQSYPKSGVCIVDGVYTESSIDLVKELVSLIRNFRGENNISPKAKPTVYYRRHDGVFAVQDLVISLAGLNTFQVLGTEQSPTLVTIVSAQFPDVELYIELKGLVDVEGELRRLEKEMQSVGADIQFVENKLNQESFVAKAPPALITKEREKLANFQSKLRVLEEQKKKLVLLG